MYFAFSVGPGAQSACACSCVAVPPAENLRDSDAVFSGTAVDFKDNNGVVFEVEESWKGVPGRSVTVYERMAGTTCEIGFEKGDSYLVYANKGGEDGPLETELCAGTEPLKYAESDVEALGPPSGALPETGGPGAAALAAIPAVLLLLVSAGALLRRRYG